MEKAELFNDIFTSAKACFQKSAHIFLILEAGLQEAKKLGATEKCWTKVQDARSNYLKVLEVLTAVNASPSSSIKNLGNQERSSTTCKLERQTLYYWNWKCKYYVQTWEKADTMFILRQKGDQGNTKKNQPHLLHQKVHK